MSHTYFDNSRKWPLCGGHSIFSQDNYISKRDVLQKSTPFSKLSGGLPLPKVSYQSLTQVPAMEEREFLVWKRGILECFKWASYQGSVRWHHCLHKAEGLLLRQASIWISTIVSSSNVSLTLATTWARCVLNSSQQPPTDHQSVGYARDPINVLARAKIRNCLICLLLLKKFNQLFDLLCSSNKIGSSNCGWFAMTAPQAGNKCLCG